jgi:hypothetical protein
MSLTTLTRNFQKIRKCQQVQQSLLFILMSEWHNDILFFGNFRDLNNNDNDLPNKKFANYNNVSLSSPFVILIIHRRTYARCEIHAHE